MKDSGTETGNNGNNPILATLANDLGRKYCAVTKMGAMFILSIMQRI
jgi:hypothetical protein